MSRCSILLTEAQNFEWEQCDEDVIGLRVDPGSVQEAVGSEHTLALEDGKAMVAIMIQDCSQYWIDGTDLGPNQMIHVLARIEGPEDVRPVVRVSWSIPSAPQSARPMGVNHDIYVRDVDGRIVLKQVQAIGNLVAMPSPGTERSCVGIVPLHKP